MILISLQLLGCPAGGQEDRILVSLYDRTGDFEIRLSNCEIRDIDGNLCASEIRKKEYYISCVCWDEAIINDTVEAFVTIQVNDSVYSYSYGKTKRTRNLLSIDGKIYSKETSEAPDNWKKISLDSLPGMNGDTLAFLIYNSY